MTDLIPPEPPINTPPVPSVSGPTVATVIPTVVEGSLHKKIPLYLLILIPILVVVAVISIYIMLQARKMYQESVVVPSPSPSPIASADPTADWKTHVDSKLGFSFKYPSEYSPQIASVNGQADPTRVDFGTETGSFLTLLTGKLTNYDEKNICSSDTKIMPCISMDSSREVSQISNTLLGGKKAKSLYIAMGTVDSDYHIILTEESPKIELRMYISGGGLDQTFDQILSTFKFAEAIKSDKKIGFIKEIRPNYDIYAIDVDYIDFVIDETAPNGFHLNNSSPAITTLMTDFVSDTSPIVTMHSGKRVTFSELIKGFEEEPEKWRGIPFWIETENGTITKITEQYIP